MINLDSDECRVLGVLIEKALTTPSQYPLTLNALASGCSQKSNREPVEQYDEPQVRLILDNLRQKRLVIEVHLGSSRVPKYRHNSREVFGLGTPQTAVLAELLLRGPQTMGELRSRASRMVAFDGLDVVEQVLKSLSDRDPQFIRELSPEPGSRAKRFGQLLCPDLHPIGEVGLTSTVRARTASTNNQLLFERLDRMETELNQLRTAVTQLAEVLGETNLLEEISSAV